MIKTYIVDEGWGKEMFGTFGVLPKECHSFFKDKQHYNINVYRDYDSFNVDLTDEEFEYLTNLHTEYYKETRQKCS